jgi:cadmium resistance protein CadD (predicted permease)
MLELLTVLAPIALIDSTSIIPLALVALINLLAGKRPYLTSSGFLAGLFFSYLVMALGFLFGLSSVLERLNAWASYRWNHPEPVDFGVEILLGLVLLFFGLKITEKRQEKSGGRQLETGVTPMAAFGYGCMVNIVGFPGAVPYFAAADRIVQAGLPVFDAIGAVVFYVAVFVLPLTLIVVLRAVVGSRMDGVMLTIKGFFDTWGKRLILVLLILLGLFLLIDGGLYFLRGEPLVPIGYPNPS